MNADAVSLQGSENGRGHFCIEGWQDMVLKLYRRTYAALCKAFGQFQANRTSANDDRTGCPLTSASCDQSADLTKQAERKPLGRSTRRNMRLL